MDVRDRIRQARAALGMTQGELGRRLGLKGATISDIERGKIRTLTSRNKSVLCRELGLNLQWLENGSGPMFASEKATLDDIAAQNGLTDIETEILGLYMKMDRDTRLSLLREMISWIADRTKRVHSWQEQASGEGQGAAAADRAHSGR